MECKCILYDNYRLRANIPWSTAKIKAMHSEKTENNKNNKNIELNRIYCVSFLWFLQNWISKTVLCAWFSYERNAVVQYCCGHNYRNNTCRIGDVFRVLSVLVRLNYFCVPSAKPVGGQKYLVSTIRFHIPLLYTRSYRKNRYRLSLNQILSKNTKYFILYFI